METNGSAAAVQSEARPGLAGRMGVFEVVCTVLAFSAPIAVVSGYIPFVIIFGGNGAPVVFLISMLLLLVFAVGFTTMSRYLPNPGAFYAYVTAGLGRVWGLGAAMLAIYGYLLMTLGGYLFFGVSANALISNVFGGPDVAWYWYALFCWAVCGTFAVLRIDLSAKVLSIAMAFEVIVVLVFDGAVFVQGGPQGRSLEPFGWTAFTSGTVGIAVLFAVTCFIGFEATAIFREEVKDPRKTVPRATYLAVVLIGVFYSLSAWLVITAFGVDASLQAANDDPPGMFSTAMAQYVGTVGVDIAAVLVVTSLFAALLSQQNILARYGYSLGVDGALPRVLGRVHPRHNSPHVASLVVSALLVLLALPFVMAGSEASLWYGRVSGNGAFVILILMLLTSVAVLVFFWRSGRLAGASPWHTRVAPGIAVLGLTVVVYLAITNFTTLIGGSMTLAVILQVVTWSVLGAGCAMALVYRRTNAAVYQSIGRQHISGDIGSTQDTMHVGD